MECKDGVCYIKNNNIDNDNGKSNNLPLPSNNSGWLIYGANWCKFCNNAKTTRTTN